MHTRGLATKIGLAILSTLVCLLVVELIFRFLSGSAPIYPGVLYATDDPSTKLWCYDEHFNSVADWDLRQEHPYSDLGYLGNVDLDPSLDDLPPSMVPYAIEIQVNESGFRERSFAGLSGEASPSALTLVVGDSFGFGQGVRTHDRFSDLLEQRLRALRPGYSRPAPTLVNLCYPGFNIGKVADIMERYVEEFDHVERVIYAFTLNDPKRSARVEGMAQSTFDFLHLRENQMEPILPLGADQVDSQMLRFFAKRMARKRLSESTIKWYRELFAETMGWDLTKRMLVDMHRFCREHGASMTLVVFPLFHNLKDYPFAEIHRKIGDFARESGIDYVDLLPAFVGEDERDYWVHPRDFHPNHLAHRKAADVLMTAIDW